MIRPNTVKRIVKRSLQHASARYGRHTRSSRKPELLILMYHRILPAADDRTRIEEPGMIVTPESFRMHIDQLKRYFKIIHLSEWARLKHNHIAKGKPACAITFDDGWADNYEYAYPILQQTGTPATIFVVSDMIGTDQIFWPERLARTVAAIAQSTPERWSHHCLDWLRQASTSYDFGDRAPTQEQLSELIAHAKSLPDQEIRVRLDRIEADLSLAIEPDQPSLLSWAQLAEMSAADLIQTGSHTCHHIRLNEETPAEVVSEEIKASKETIERHTGRPVSSFCFPNGDYSERALNLVRQNYEFAVTTRTGWNDLATDDHTLRRVGVHEDIAHDKTAFLSRISGWL